MKRERERGEEKCDYIVSARKWPLLIPIHTIKWRENCPIDRFETINFQLCTLFFSARAILHTHNHFYYQSLSEYEWLCRFASPFSIDYFSVQSAQKKCHIFNGMCILNKFKNMKMSNSNQKTYDKVAGSRVIFLCICNRMVWVAWYSKGPAKWTNFP